MYSDTTSQPKFWIIAGFILFAGILRVLFSEIPNIAPIAAMALLGGIYFKNKKLAFLIPMVVMLLSDIVLEIAHIAGIRQFGGFHEMIPFVYAGFIGIVAIGTLFKDRVKPLPLISAGLLSSILFFIVSNFGVWITAAGTFYPMNFSGLVGCYVAAIPFLRLSVLGDLLFIGVFFGAFEMLKAKYPSVVFATR